MKVKLELTMEQAHALYLAAGNILYSCSEREVVDFFCNHQTAKAGYNAYRILDEAIQRTREDQAANRMRLAEQRRSELITESIIEKHTDT